MGSPGGPAEGPALRGGHTSQLPEAGPAVAPPPAPPALPELSVHLADRAFLPDLGLSVWDTVVLFHAFLIPSAPPLQIPECLPASLLSPPPPCVFSSSNWVVHAASEQDML